MEVEKVSKKETVGWCIRLDDGFGHGDRRYLQTFASGLVTRVDGVLSAGIWPCSTLEKDDKRRRLVFMDRSDAVDMVRALRVHDKRDDEFSRCKWHLVRLVRTKK
jgi:hypothetical protein